MKERIIAIVVAIGILAVIVILWLSGQNVKFLEDVEASDVEKIEMCLSGYITITEQQDISNIIEKLQAMEFDDALFNNDKDGGFDVRVYLKDGTKTSFVFLGDKVNINADTYNCDSQYGDELQEMFLLLSEKYPYKE